MITETVELMVETESGIDEIAEECYEGRRFIRRTVTTIEEANERD